MHWYFLSVLMHNIAMMKHLSASEDYTKTFLLPWRIRGNIFQQHFLFLHLFQGVNRGDREAYGDTILNRTRKESYLPI